MEDTMGKYDWDDDRFGGITLTRKADGADVYFQGDDAAQFRADVEKLDKIWFRPFGKCADGRIAYRKSFGPFNSYSEHFDALVSAYDDVMTIEGENNE
jgi:hypothetical protein